ncbi:dipeptidase PepV [Lactobacillus delbrueckii subsp. indicus DSM 15996]|nr:dipeptidase PepV [Lactobacillus delbrueckii subsp. indicus DSM 15996]
MIPAAATAVVSGENLEKIAAAFPDFLAKKGLTGEIKETASENGNCLKISLEGVSAHASVPWEGKNGAYLLASFLRDFPFTGRAKNFLDFAGDIELEDYYGEKIGIANTDSEMGKSINCPAVFRYQRGQAGATVISAGANYGRFFKRSATGLPSPAAWTPPTPSTNPSAWLNWKKAWPSTLTLFTN